MIWAEELHKVGALYAREQREGRSERKDYTEL